MKNKKKVILISCICAVVVIAMAAGAVVLMNRSGKVADEQKAPEATQAPVVTATPELSNYSTGCRFFNEISKIGAECVNAPLEI